MVLEDRAIKGLFFLNLSMYINATMKQLGLASLCLAIRVM